jgi:hypothetical protein
MRITPKALIATTLVVLVLLGGFGYLANALYWHPQDRPWVRTLVTRLPIPVARVSGQYVRYGDYLVQQDATKVFLHSPVTQGQPMPKDLDAAGNQLILDQLVRGAAVRSMAQAAHIELSPKDVDTSYDALVARAGTSTDPGEIKSYLHDAFGWDVDEFKKRVVAPATLETAVRQEVYKNDDAAFEKALEEELKKVVKYIQI